MKTTKIELRPAVGFIDFADQEYYGKIMYALHDLLGIKGDKIETRLKRIINLNKHKEKIRQFQKRQPAMDMFVRPEKPDQSNRKYYDLNGTWFDSSLYNKDLEQWENWQPVFLNKEGKDWFKANINPDLISWILQCGSIDEFINGCKDNLFWNPDHETVKGLFYPDK